LSLNIKDCHFWVGGLARGFYGHIAIFVPGVVDQSFLLFQNYKELLPFTVVKGS